MRRHRTVQRLVLCCLAALVCALIPSPATAGTYQVIGTCGAWDPVNHNPARFAVFTICPSLIARHSLGNFRTAAGDSSAWIFTAPPGTAIETAQLSASMVGQNGWQSTIYLHGGSMHGVALEHCTSATCSGGDQYFDGRSWAAGGASDIVARVRCGATNGCYNGEQKGYVLVFRSNVTIADWSAPAVGAGGSLAAPGWKSGTATVDVGASDNVGIRETRALVDGVPRAVNPRACNDTFKVPCPNGTDTLSVALGALADGRHTLTVQAADSAGNWAAADTAIQVDNTAPVSPEAPELVGGAGWRSVNNWAVRWSNPKQAFAPIVASRYSLCPAAADSTDPIVSAKAKQSCVSGTRSGTGIAQISDLSVPGPGSWTLRLWLVDAAGNSNANTAVKLEGFGFDPSPPTGVAFLEQDGGDPARLHVAAQDDVSGLASGSIELRRHGEDVWRPLPTHVTPQGLTAAVDDEVLPKGPYDLRAVAVNGAGLQQGSSVRADGRPATIALPIRLGSRLIAGRFVRRCVANKRCSTAVRKRLSAPLNRATRIRGRLTVRGKPVPYEDLEVWSRLAMSGAGWERTGVARTTGRGRFSYLAPKGAARVIRFRYGGSPQVRGANAPVRVDVAAKTTIEVNREQAVNGEYVKFSGRLKGGFIPPVGTLVELQVYTRGRWRIFAQPRAAVDSGRWSFQYRFETIRGSVRFRFRARIRRQPGYPFRTGHSRMVAVTVHGL